jgi:hypothetical protein
MIDDGACVDANRYRRTRLARSGSRLCDVGFITINREHGETKHGLHH